MNAPTADILIKNFSIIFSHHNTIDLKIAEAINIKQDKPYINIKYDQGFSVLKLH
jgi:hypothetical protein